MHSLKTAFVLVMLLIVVFPVLYSAYPLQNRTPFDVKIQMVGALVDNFVAFPDFPSPPTLKNPLGLLSYISSFMFTFGIYLRNVIVFFTHNISIGSQILRVLLMA